MRAWSPALLARLASGEALSARLLVWIAARNRTTGLVETVGLWTGEADRDFVIGGVPRTYRGAGAFLSAGPAVYGTGLKVRYLTLTLSGVSEAAEALFRTYDARLAAVEVHRAVYAQETVQLLEEPHRVWLGTAGEPVWTRPAPGDPATIELPVASTARALTRTLALKKSDETQKLLSGDRGRRWAAVAGRISIWWGTRPRRQGGERGTGRFDLGLNLGGDR